MKQKAFDFGEYGIIEFNFHKNKKSIHINEVDMKRTVLSNTK